MTKKYQVFVSSTYLDMKEERQAAVMAILDAGHIPAGMELFAAGDEAQWETIKRWIDESDVFLLLLGGRYGSIEPNSGLSYIELEYDYAVAQGKSFFALVAEDQYLHAKAAKNTEAFEKDNSLNEKLSAFRQSVLGKTSAFYATTDKIGLEIHKSLKVIERKNIPGWIRENEQQDISGILQELNEIRKERDDLKKQLNVFEKNAGSSNKFAIITKRLKTTRIDSKDTLYDFFVKQQFDFIQGVKEPNEPYDFADDSIPKNNSFLWKMIVPQLEKHGLMAKNKERRPTSVITQLGKDVLIYIEDNKKQKK